MVFIVLLISLFCCCFLFFFFKQKTAYEMRISDGSSDVCSSDLRLHLVEQPRHHGGDAVEMSGTMRTVEHVGDAGYAHAHGVLRAERIHLRDRGLPHQVAAGGLESLGIGLRRARIASEVFRSEEHTSELQSLMRISYAVFCLKKKKQ